MCDDAHRVEQLTAKKLEPDDAVVGIVGQQLLEQEQVVWLPETGIRSKQRFDLGQRVDDLDARPTAALIRFEQGWPCNRVLEGAKRRSVVEGERQGGVDVECSKQRSLRALAQLQCEHVRAVQHTSAVSLQRPQVGQCQRHRPRVAAHIRARAGLVEIEPRLWHLVIGEGCRRDVERLERDAPTLQRREQRLLPLGVFMNDDEVGRRFRHPTILEWLTWHAWSVVWFSLPPPIVAQV